MLHVAERILAQEAQQTGAPDAWRRSYYMPAPADRYASLFPLLMMPVTTLHIPRAEKEWENGGLRQ